MTDHQIEPPLWLGKKLPPPENVYLCIVYLEVLSIRILLASTTLAIWIHSDFDTEIRDIVYEELLVTSCTQPGVPKKSLNSQFYAAPFARVLEASRTIYTEAIGILYAHNIFSTLNIRANDNIVCFLDKSFIGKPSTRGYSAGHTIEPDWSKIWENCHQAVSDDVAKIYDEDARNLPEWLFGELSDADFQREIINANGRAHLRHVWHYGLGGDQIDLPPFLRQIGPLNAARIESIQICFRDLERTRCQFPFFAEVLKQHVRSLKKLKIGKTVVESGHFK